MTTDTASANSGALKNNFDKEKVQSEINLQTQVTQQFDANRQEAKAEINKKIDEAQKDYENGNLSNADYIAKQKTLQRVGLILDSVSAGLSAPTASSAGIAAAALSPAASYEIGQYFKGKDAEGSTGHIVAHTLLGAAVAAIGGNNALSAGLAAGSAEAAAPVLSKYLYGKAAKDLSSSEKSTISAITGLVASGVAATTDDVASTVQSGQVAQNAVENNKTSYKQDIKKVFLCWTNECLKQYNKTDAKQQIAYLNGQNKAIEKFADDIKKLPNVPEELYRALKDDPKGTALAIKEALKNVPAAVWDTTKTLAVVNAVGDTPEEFEKLGEKVTALGLTAILGGAVKVVAVGGKIVFVAVKDANEARKIAKAAEFARKKQVIENNIHYDDDLFTDVAEKMTFAKNNNWKTPEGRILWPPNDGIVPTSQFKNTLPIGTKLDRFGGTNEKSSFLAPIDVPLDARALSPNTNLQIRDVYEVVKPLPVIQSNVMPWFGKKGMGIQYETKGRVNLTVQELVEKGYLRKIDK